MRSPWLKRLSTVVVCLTSAKALAQDELKYARPDGQDQYGTKYEARGVPSEMYDFLDDQGQYVVPSFINLTIDDENQECWVTDQTPAAGVIVTGPQVVTVHLTYTSDGSDQRAARLPIALSDITPPSIELLMYANTSPHTSFGGIPRYVAPPGGAAVVPLVTITDSCDSNPSCELFLNGQQYAIGTPVTNLGTYFLGVHSSDSGGNTSEKVFVFEIRQWPSYSAVAVVQSVQWDIAPDGQSGSFDATVLVADEQFEHHDILLSSVRLFLRGADGRYLNTHSISIHGGFAEPCPMFQAGDAHASINECWLQLRFTGQFVPDGAAGGPAGMDILGVGTLGGSDVTFEWGARATSAPDPTPVHTLMVLADKVEPCGTGAPIHPQPQPACQQVETWTISPGSCLFPATPPTVVVCSGTTRSDAFSGPSISGNSYSTAHSPGAVICTAASPCSTAGMLFLVENLVNCCNCAITFTGTASVAAFTSVSGGGGPIGGAGWTANANADGSLNFTAPCGSGLADASNVANPTTPTPPTVTGTGGINCSHNSCTSWLSIQGSMSVSTNAVATGGSVAVGDNVVLSPAQATATARVTTGSFAVSATATGSPCPTDPCSP